MSLANKKLIEELVDKILYLEEVNDKLRKKISIYEKKFDIIDQNIKSCQNLVKRGDVDDVTG